MNVWSSVLRPFLLKARHVGAKNASHLLMGAGTGCSLAAIFSAPKAVTNAKASQDYVRFEKTFARLAKEHPNASPVDIKQDLQQGKICKDKLTFGEWFKAVIRYYGPMAALEILSLICFWGAHGIDIHRQTVLLGLVATGEETIREYQKKVQELIGKEAEKEIGNAIAQDRVEKLPPPQNTYILDGEADRQFVYVFHDGTTQYFNSNYYKIKQAENDANHDMIQNMYISEAEVIWLLDPERKWLKPVHGSGDVGWSVDDLLRFTVDWADGPQHQPIGMIKITDKDGLPYYPKPGFSKMC